MEIRRNTPATGYWYDFSLKDDPHIISWIWDRINESDTDVHSGGKVDENLYYIIKPKDFQKIANASGSTVTTEYDTGIFVGRSIFSDIKRN